MGLSSTYWLFLDNDRIWGVAKRGPDLDLKAPAKRGLSMHALSKGGERRHQSRRGSSLHDRYISKPGETKVELRILAGKGKGGGGGGGGL